MKKIKCTSVGGPAECTHVFEVENFDAFMEQAKPHFGEKHADMVKDATEEQKKEWVAMATKVVEDTADEA